MLSWPELAHSQKGIVYYKGIMLYNFLKILVFKPASLSLCLWTLCNVPKIVFLFYYFTLKYFRLLFFFLFLLFYLLCYWFQVIEILISEM